MAELEKKFSDFQKTECKDFELDEKEQGGDKFCPTCIPNPNFVLEAPWWEIRKSYLNEAECEYHVRVHNPPMTEKIVGADDRDLVLEGVKKILKGQDKPYNNQILEDLRDVAYIKDDYVNIDIEEKGPAYLIAVPAFDFDRIDPDDVDEESEESKGINTGLEFVVDGATLSRNMRQLRSTIYLYRSYYSLAQDQVGDQFIIRQENNKAMRISYKSAWEKLKNFREALNDALRNKKYARLDAIGSGGFYYKTAAKIKFLFEDNGQDYYLKDIYVRAEDGCNFYEKLHIDEDSVLRSPAYRIVYHFMSRIEKMVSEITAKEPKPWAEWTIDHWYPKMMLDNDANLDTEDMESGLSCLIENQLGLGPQLTDSLAKEIMSTFKSIEKEAQKNACREIENRAEGSATTISAAKASSAQKQKDALALKKYQDEFVNKFYNGHDQPSEIHFGGSWLGIARELEINHSLPEGTVTPDKVWSFETRGEQRMEAIYEGKKSAHLVGEYPQFPVPTYSYIDKETKEKKDRGSYYRRIDYEEMLESEAKIWAQQKLKTLNENKPEPKEKGPHNEEAQAAENERFKFPENSVTDIFKRDGFKDAMRALTLCNTSKLGKKAAKCILAGVSIDDFLDAIIDKTFEFIKINTLDLFLGGLPASFRAELDEAIAQEFGGNVNIATLISLKKVNEGEAKMSDVTKMKQLAKDVFNIYKKEIIKQPPRPGKNTSELAFNQADQLILDKYNLGKTTFNKGTIEDLISDCVLYEKQLKNDNITDGQREAAKELLKESKRAANKVIKKAIKKSKDSLIKRASKRMSNAIVYDTSEPDDPTQPTTFEKAVQSFDETALGTKVDVVYDVIFDYTIDYILDSFGVDELLEDLRKYPVLDFIGDLVVTAFTCPNAPVIFPPLGDWSKSLSVDVCDPTTPPTMPKIVWPNINPLKGLRASTSDIIADKMIDLCEKLFERFIKRLINTLESTLCSTLGVGVNALADFAKDRGSAKQTFIDALNTSFCNDSTNSETGNSRAQELAEALFTPLLMQSGQNYQGSAQRVTKVISSVAGTNEFLNAMVAGEGEQNEQFGRAIANAVNELTPEMAALLGTPDQVAYFFRSVGSFLSPDDRERIRNLLDSGIPNLPMSKSICLSDEQLKEWNNLREELLGDLGGRGVVEDLNRRTREAAEEILDLFAGTDDMFADGLGSEIEKDVCNPNNVFNDVYQSDLEKDIEGSIIDSEYENLLRIMSFSFFRKNGIFGHALSDNEGRSEFARSFFRFLFPGYTNSAQDWTVKYNSKNKIGKIFMDKYNDGDPRGNYPETVGIKLRDDLLEGMIDYDFNKVKDGIRSSRNVVFKYKDEDGSFTYRTQIAASNLRQPKKVFGYNLQILSKTEDDAQFERELNFNTPILITEAEDEFMRSFGFTYKANDKKNIRLEAFSEMMRSKIPLNVLGQNKLTKLYENTYKMCTNNLVEALLSDYSVDDEIPNGFKFGYTSDDLSKDSFEYYNPETTTPYNLPEEEKTLGEFANKRIIALDPTKYGGRYSNPHYFIEPRQHKGFTELAIKSFRSQDGCEPKNPPLLDMTDVKNREKELANTLKNDPRLSRKPECINDIPFKLLANAKMQAKMDATVRFTLRTYLVEYFIKGYGLFSNLQVRFDNFDQSLPLYLSNQMKKDMHELGTWASNKKVRIVRERYWYTFLEQCVETYQRMIDVDEVEPRPEIRDALDEIQQGLDLYRNIHRDLKKSMRRALPDEGVRKPPANFDPLEEMQKGMMNMGYMSIAYRISEDRENFFNGEVVTDISGMDIRYASIKKLRFFQKIYFIRLYEKQATLIMSELIRDELNRLNAGVVDGLSDKPNYYDLHRSFFGMKSFFPNSTSKVGTNDFYSGLGGIGKVPDIKNNLINPPVEQSDKPQFVVERYVRFVDREGSTAPTQIKNRGLVYQGAVSLKKASDFIDQNINLIEDNYLSDFFGDLRFTYSSSFKSLMDKGFSDNKSINILVELNPGMRDQINSATSDYIMSKDFEDFEVSHDESFILEGDQIEPTGTIGTTGVKYGLRICLVLPDEQNGGLSDDEKSKLLQNTEFYNLGRREKTFLFEDGTLSIPLVSTEVDVLDSKFEDFDPLDGEEPYDLECLINAMVLQPDFQTIFDKFFNFKQTSSMLAVYCMETMMPSVGRGPDERIPGSEEEPVQDAEQWDGTINKFFKNMLRKKFKSIYLSSHVDGLTPDEDDDSERSLLRLGNPLSSLQFQLGFKLPWWKIRLREYNVYDKNGQDCADPKKDLR